MNRKHFSPALGILFSLGIIVLFWVGYHPGPPAVSNFAECVSRGFSILETFPRQCRTTDGETFTEQPGASQTGSGSRVVVDTPKQNELIASPLTVEGSAVGNWYFEGQFPVKVLDGHQKVIGAGVAHAKGQSTTQATVPFTALVVFSEEPTTSTGTLILEKDNPSGLPENADQELVPVRFAK